MQSCTTTAAAPGAAAAAAAAAAAEMKGHRGNSSLHPLASQHRGRLSLTGSEARAGAHLNINNASVAHPRIKKTIKKGQEEVEGQNRIKMLANNFGAALSYRCDGLGHKHSEQV